MERTRTVRSKAALGALVGAIAAACALAAPASGAPTCDIVERFGADPLQDGRWFVNGSWSWEPRVTNISSMDGAAGSLLWTACSHYTGSVSLRLRLHAVGARARLLFAHDPASGAHRWVEIAAGEPGRVTLGQTGAIGGSAPGVIQTWRVPVATESWLSLGVVVAGDKSVTVTLGGSRLFTAAASPLAPGLVGFASIAGPVGFGEFRYTANPDGEPCRECHAGRADQPLAANVYAYWDGRWWDANQGGSPSVQEGGHGDPAGKAALGCTGSNGCHEMRQPTPEGHRNGIREGRANRSVNAYHLRPGFIVESPVNPWDAQVVFDNYCTLVCHVPALVPVMTHENDGNVAVGPVQFGQGLTFSDGESRSVPVDSDLTRRATTTQPDFAPCVSCHDPHGTGSAKVQTVEGTRTSNRMLRGNYTLTSSELCSKCHR